LSNFQDILNAHRATLGASMILLEKNAPNWVTANKIRLSMYQPIGFTLSCSRSILNAHRASSKRVQNKNDNLNVLEPKHMNFKEEYKIKERVKKKLISGSTCLYLWLLNDITFRNF
jgi:hypothetical protein